MPKLEILGNLLQLMFLSALGLAIFAIPTIVGFSSGHGFWGRVGGGTIGFAIGAFLLVVYLGMLDEAETW
ncbi:MAG TPA: hypothetical protein VLE72_02820 [Candidatus Saccharimonadales bacterium]|nr:hypothetical protein [Candidatus Saccharimonadales bacterium]